MQNFKTKNLTKSFGGVRALNNVSIEIAGGKVTSIIGPNGSGKTTLVNVLSGMLSPDKGALCIDGADITRIHPYDARGFGITRTFQNIRVFEQMTVLDNLLVVLTERNVFGALFERHKEFHTGRANELLKRVSLFEKRDALARDLSYGQRKLLEIARAIGVDAQLYLFDEPFAGLFPEMVKIISSIIRELRSAGKTIILIEHSMDLVRELSDTVIVMDSGSVLAEGAPETVLESRVVKEVYLGV